MNAIVVACSNCKRPWAAMKGSVKVKCPRCGRSYRTDTRRVLFEGDARQAARAVQELAIQKP